MKLRECMLLTFHYNAKLISCSIYAVHDEAKDKDFELEMTWVCEETGGKHFPVPKELLEEAERLAKEKMDEEMED